jgi:hypothetical protein
MKNTYIKIIAIIIVTAAFYNIYGQSGMRQKEDIEKKIKESLRIDASQIDSSRVINGINISKEHLPSLSDLSELKPKKMFYISENKDKQYFVTYHSKWYQNKESFIEVTLSVLNSGYEAKEYLLDKYILETTLPIEMKINSIDLPKKVGDLSFFNGRVFIRNNVVVEVFAEGDISARIVKISKEIDSLLLQQKNIQSKADILPRVIIDSNNVRKIVEL